MGDRQYCPNHPPRWCCPHRAPLTSAHRACQPFSRPKGGAISRHLAPSRWYQHGFSDPKKCRLRRKPVPEKNTACGAHANPGCHACCGELLAFMILFRIASPYAYAWPLHRGRCRCHRRAYAHVHFFSAVVLWSLNSAWHFAHGARPANQRFLCRFPMCVHQARPRRTCASLHPIAHPISGVHIRDCARGHYHPPCARPGRRGTKNSNKSAI